jgi:hypothetical protein
MEPSHSNPPPSEALLDLGQLNSFVAIGYDDYIDLLGDAVTDVTLHLTAIQAAIQQGNQAELRARSHSLRGMLSYFGCIAMTSRLKLLEENTSLTPPQAALMHAELEAMWVKSLAAIKAWEKTVPEFARS